MCVIHSGCGGGTPIIPALRKLKREDCSRLIGLPGPHSELQASLGWATE